jgi:hypothetical protein
MAAKTESSINPRPQPDTRNQPVPGESNDSNESTESRETKPPHTTTGGPPTAQ